MITLDLPGFGRSSAPVGFGSSALYARYVLALLDHLGIAKAIIGGHSMGGIITQELYREAPGRFSGMILIDTIAQAASSIEQGEWIGYAIQASTNGVSLIINTVVPQLLTGDTRYGDPAAGLAIEDIIADGKVSGAQAGAETLAVRPDYTAQLSRIAVPTLVLRGWRTRSTPSRSPRDCTKRSSAPRLPSSRGPRTLASSSSRPWPTRRSCPGRTPPVSDTAGSREHPS